MKILYYDCFAGISGDMHLGAMLDLGVDQNYLLEQLEKLDLNGYQLEITREHRQSIEGTRVKVQLSKDKKYQVRRNLRDIEAIIQAGSLSDTVVQRSLEMFRRLATVEAKVHGKSVDDIHFHELGAIDAIVDIVGAAICHESLKVDKVLCGPVEVGGGFVETAHGTFPVPAPATIELLQDIPVRTGKVEFETTTPTGAVILASIVDQFGKEFDFSLEKTGYGIGGQDLPIPNVLRVCLGTQQLNAGLVDQSVMIECNIDDMNPEFYSYLMDKLLAQGAQDVFITPIIMKKTRPASKLSVLCASDDEDKFIELLQIETTTLGVRKYAVERSLLPRKEFIIETDYGSVGVKAALFENQPIKWKAEYEDCIKIASENNIPLQTVYDEVDRILLKYKQ